MSILLAVVTAGATAVMSCPPLNIKTVAEPLVYQDYVIIENNVDICKRQAPEGYECLLKVVKIGTVGDYEYHCTPKQKTHIQPKEKLNLKVKGKD